MNVGLDVQKIGKGSLHQGVRLEPHNEVALAGNGQKQFEVKVGTR